MFLNKKRVFLVLSLVVFLVTVSVVVFVNKPEQKPYLFDFGSTPTPIINPIKQTVLKNEAKIIDRINNQQPLPAADVNAKTNVINLLKNTSGSPISTNEFRVDYLYTNGLFQVEILTTNTDQAKADAVSWFISQGFTQDGICKLPVMFYLNFNVKQQLPDHGANFNPLADGC
jgi:hypothetical protein